MSRPGVKLSQLAAHLQLSASTVSRALNGYADVSPTTRARVAAAAQQLGYRPDPVGRQLRTGRTDAIGLVLPAAVGQVSDPFFLSLISGAGAEADAAGVDLLISSHPPDADEVDFLRRLTGAPRVDGIILCRTRVADARVACLQDQDVPFVTMGRTDAAQPHAYVDIDSESGFHAATAWLLAQGRRRPGMVATEAGLITTGHRVAGFRRALAEVDHGPAPVAYAEMSLAEQSAAAAAAGLLAEHPDTDAIVCGSDLIALGVSHAVRAAGRAPGRDILLTGCDGLPLARLANPPIPTLPFDAVAAGRRLAEMLLAVIGGADPAEQQELWPLRLALDP